MELRTTSPVAMEVGNPFVSPSPSQSVRPPLMPVSSTTLPEPALLQTPKRMTMRERAIALREARLKRNQSKSAKKQSEDNASNRDADLNEASNAAITRQQKTRGNANAPDNEASAVGEQESETPVAQRQPQPLRPKRGKKILSRKESSTTKRAKIEKTIPNPAERSMGYNETGENGREDVLPKGQGAPSKAGSKTDSPAYGDHRKRKSTSDAVSGKEARDDSHNDPDVVLVHGKVMPTPPRPRKKARVDKSRSAAPAKASPKSPKKNKGKSAPQSPSTATATVPSTQIALVSELQGDVQASSKKRKSLRLVARGLDDDTLKLVKDMKRNESTTIPFSKDPPPSGTPEQETEPRPQKKRRGRPRKNTKLEESHPPRPAETTVKEEDQSSARGSQAEPSPDIQHQHQAKSKGRKAKRNVSDEVQSAKKASGEAENELDSSKANTPNVRRSLRFAAKSKSPGSSAAEQKNELRPFPKATEVAGVEEVGSNKAIPSKKAVHANEGSVSPASPPTVKAKQASPKERALQSVTKSKRFSLSASHQGALAARLVQRRDSTMIGSRRQSLSHREGLSRLTSVVDQLQLEGEAFLETEHGICDQLMPFSSELGSHRVSNLVEGYVGAAVSNGDRKAIADSALRDAVTQAKLEFQAKQRAVITELAGKLVKAVKDWKSEKNTVLRDMIPEELRPEAVPLMESFEQRVQAVEDANGARVNSEAAGAVKEGGVNEAKEKIGDSGKNANCGATGNENGTKGTNGTRTVKVGAQSVREKTVRGMRALENANELKKFVGFAYSDLNLHCYRSCAILKLCEHEEGLTYDELYRLTPLGKLMLKKKLGVLVGAKHLNERWVQMNDGKRVAVYHTVPQVARMQSA